MKNLLIFSIGIIITACNQNPKNKLAETKIEVSNETENFDWLLGKWKRSNETVGKETFENWEKINSSTYRGIGFTIKNDDTIKQEKMSLTKINSAWNLSVKVLEEPKPTIFKMDEFDETEFTCKNDSIDFPNKIKYWRDEKKLKAAVSSPELEILFEFEKNNTNE